MAGPYRIHLSIPHVTGDEHAVLENVWQNGFITTAGPELSAFEAELAAYISPPTPHFVLAVNSGTAALHLALLLLGVGPGDEVACASLTFVGGANPIRYLGATPVFVDSEPLTLNMDPYWLRICLTDRQAKGKQVKAVIVTHLFGRCAALPEIVKICQEFEVPLIEDAAEAMGATCQQRMAGTWGDYGFYSFNGNKVMTTGGGGALVLKTPAHYERALYYATQARDSVIPYQHSQLGYNYRLSNVLAGVGLAQLKHLPAFIQRRRAIATFYQERLSSIPDIHFLPETPGTFTTHWLSLMQYSPPQADTSSGFTTQKLQADLQALGIETRPVWTPLHTTQLYQSYPFYGSGVCTDIFRQCLCLPSSSHLADEQLDDVCRAIQKSLAP